MRFADLLRDGDDSVAARLYDDDGDRLPPAIPDTAPLVNTLYPISPGAGINQIAAWLEFGPGADR